MRLPECLFSSRPAEPQLWIRPNNGAAPLVSCVKHTCTHSNTSFFFPPSQPTDRYGFRRNASWKIQISVVLLYTARKLSPAVISICGAAGKFLRTISSDWTAGGGGANSSASNRNLYPHRAPHVRASRYACECVCGDKLLNMCHRDPRRKRRLINNAAGCPSFVPA